MLSDLRDPIEQLVVHDLPLRGPGLYLHKDLTSFRAITTIQTSLHTSVSTSIEVNTAMAVGLVPAHRADHLFSGPDSERQFGPRCSEVHVHPPRSTVAIGRLEGKGCLQIAHSRSRQNERQLPKTFRNRL